MIRKNLIKATLITTVIATLLASSGCGKKVANNNETTVQPVTVSAETASNAAKELTKTGLVTFNYTDVAGNTYTLEGKAVASENGDATIEVTDVQGNKVTFTGKAKTIDGKLSVSDIAVKETGTLVKADGSKIEIATDATVADASESTEGESNSDISVSDDVKQEIETAKKEESVIEAAREEVTKAESNVADNDNVAPEEPKNDISDMPTQPDTTPEKPNITPEEPKNDTQDRPAEPDVKPEEPKDDTPDTPNEPDVTPAQPDTTPEEPKEDTPVTPVEPAPEPEKPAATHMETKYIYYHNFDGSLYYTDSVTYLAYEDGTPVEEILYDESQGPDAYPDSGDTDKWMYTWMINTGKAVPANNEQMFISINLADYPGDIHMYPGWI